MRKKEKEKKISNFYQFSHLFGMILKVLFGYKNAVLVQRCFFIKHKTLYLFIISTDYPTRYLPSSKRAKP